MSPDTGQLALRLAKQIEGSGPISVAEYMRASNNEYYGAGDPFGVEGDFITAPEISQMFGELIGMWLTDLYLRQNSPANCHYVELGPGRGTLAADALRAMVPVDLRPPERAGELGNEFGLVILELAITSARASQRLAITKTRMDALKHSPEAMAIRVLFEIFGHGPKALEDVANVLFGSKASIVMTNVMGPSEVLYLAGVPIDRLMAWAPHPGKELGMAISIMSYHGKACVTIGADAGLVPDPELIADLFNREFQTMLRSAKSVTASSAKHRIASNKSQRHSGTAIR